MTTLVFLHGWGCDARLWDGVRARLDGPSLCVDAGFYAAPQPLPDSLPEDAVLVGHSLGFARGVLLSRRWAGIVSVNGFPRFTRCDDFPTGVAPRLLQRMIDRFGDDPQGVTTDFLRRCGLPEPDVRDLRPAPLLQGLQALLDIDVRGHLADFSGPVTVLAGTADVIVPPPMTEAGFAPHPIAWRDGGDHLLPLSAPDWLADHLKALL